MTPEVQKIHDFVSELEDDYYKKLSGNGGLADMRISAQAGSFQKVRYFIETMGEKP